MTMGVRAEQHAASVLSAADYKKYLPIVRRTAMLVARKVPANITVNDLVGYAWLGLVDAFSCRERDMNDERFEAYACYRIRGSILDHLRSLDAQTRTRRAQSRRMTQAISRVAARVGRTPEEAEIAEELGLDIEDYRVLLEELEGAGMSRLEMLDIDTTLSADDVALPEEAVRKKELRDAVAEAITRLPERLQHVLSLYYVEDCTIRQIGLALDLTESRVCQLHSEAVHRLRAAVGGE